MGYSVNTPHKWINEFDFPPPNFEKPQDKGWSLIAKAIIHPHEKVAK